MTDLETKRPTTSRATTTDDRRPARNWAVLAIVGMLLLGAGVVGWMVGSADDDASVDIAIELPDAIQRWADAWSSRDADAFADTYEEDGRFDGVLGTTFTGRREIRDGIETYWAPDAPDVRLTAEYFFDDGTVAVVVWNIEEPSSPGSVVPDQRITNYEWDWDRGGLLRSSSQNW